MKKHAQLEAELKHYRQLETQLRMQLKESETKCSKLQQRLTEVLRREKEIVLKLAQLDKKLERLRLIVGAEKQLTMINQKKFRREIASLRQQLNEATEKLRATETVTRATRSREVYERKDERSELNEIWEKIGIEYTEPLDTGICFSFIFIIFMK